jgi:hypothetical protein
MIDYKLNTLTTNKLNDWAHYNALLSFDLPTLIEKMKHSLSWYQGELNAKILVESPSKQILLTALHGGTEIEFSQTFDSITIQVIEGRLSFHSRDESVTLEKSKLIALHENIKYSLTCSEETVFLLTIIKTQ